MGILPTAIGKLSALFRGLSCEISHSFGGKVKNFEQKAGD